MPRTLNTDRRRCAWCDAPFRNNSDLIVHQLEHRGSAEGLAAGLERAAAIGLRAVEQDEGDDDDASFSDDDGYSDLGLSDADLEEPQP